VNRWHVADFINTGSISEATLGAMQADKEYSLAEILTAVSIAESNWTWAIKQLKEQGQVAQIGKNRGAWHQIVIR
jgi:hypothetical protein